MTFAIRTVAVIGSGTMGAGIAAHLANAGLQVLLYDMIPEACTPEEVKAGFSTQSKEVRYRIVKENIEKMSKHKPSPLFSPQVLKQIRACNLKDDVKLLTQADWVIEAVSEKLALKQQLFEQLEPFIHEQTIISTNTSGLSIQSICSRNSPSFKKRFLGTHFFNPPRYLKLLEIIPTSQTDSELIETLAQFAKERLGKGVVIAKDTPCFIANRIGCYSMMITLQEMISSGYSIGEIDSVTGPALGRTKAATFRTLDVVGLDTFAYVCEHMSATLTDPAEQQIFATPGLLKHLLKAGSLGEKADQGFYLKRREQGESRIYEFDSKSMEYIPQKKLQAPSLQKAKQIQDVGKRIAHMVWAQDKAGLLAWQLMKKILLYSAHKAEEMADFNLEAIDKAMKWGFGWEMGPFEAWDAIGLKQSIHRMQQEGESIPTWLLEQIENGKEAFYLKEKEGVFYLSKGGYQPLEKDPRQIDLAELKAANRLVKSNPGASLIDMGDGVLCLEFHSPKQAVGADILFMLQAALEETAKHYEGLVIGNQGKHFCVGANLMLVLMEAQDHNWLEIELMIRRFQEASTAIKYSPKPVVAAPFGMTLGGGTELVLPAARIQAAAETYMGLVEAGVGLIPAGGGTKELMLCLQALFPEEIKHEQQEILKACFERIALAKVSGSAAEARMLGFLSQKDGITMNQSYLLFEAKQAVLNLAKAHYVAPQPAKVEVSGCSGKAVLTLAAHHYRESGYASAHDFTIASKLAHVLSGGDIPMGSKVTEQYLLDLEREAFLSLCGEPKTQARIAYMLRKGKPLRN